MVAHSFWKAWGGGGGGEITKIYDKSVNIIDELPSINLSNIMKKYRLRQLLKFIPHAFHGDDPKDPWNPVKVLVEGFNINRSQKVVASYVKVLDEMMSGWAPGTTQWEGLLHCVVASSGNGGGCGAVQYGVGHSLPARSLLCGSHTKDISIFLCCRKT